jgi:fatty acid amide hydrolase
VRIPAAFCGLYGFKPTPARVTTHGFQSVGPFRYRGNTSIAATAGPISRCVEDCVAFMEALWTPAVFAKDLVIPPVPFRRTLYESDSPLRIGYFESDGFFEPAPSYRRAVREAVAALRGVPGVTVVPFTPPNMSVGVLLYYSLMTADAGEIMLTGLYGEKLHPHYAQLEKVARLTSVPRSIVARVLALFGEQRLSDILKAGGAKSAFEFFNEMSRLKEWVADFNAAYRSAGLDALLSPALALPAYKLGQSYVVSLWLVSAHCVHRIVCCDWVTGRS